MFIKRIATLLLAAVSFTLTTCNENSSSDVYLKFNLKAGDQPLAYNTTYTTAFADIQFTLVKFYVSMPALTAPDAGKVFSDTYFLVDADSSNRFLMGTIASDFNGISFGLGVDSSRNDSTGSLAIPAFDYDVNHPLSASNQMYWSWKPGYIWMKLEGKVDLDGNGSFGDPGETFGIHTGFSEAYREISSNYAIVPGNNDITLNIDADILRFFDNYDLTQPKRNAHPMSSASPDFPYILEIVNNSSAVFGEVYE